MAITLFDRTIDQLARGLEYAGRRHEVLAENIANLETPGYKARDVVFGAELAHAVRAINGAPGATGPGVPAPRVVVANDGPPAANGNDVNLDRQMARLAENTLFHHTLVQLLASQFTALKQAVSGRV